MYSFLNTFVNSFLLKISVSEIKKNDLWQKSYKVYNYFTFIIYSVFMSFFNFFVLFFFLSNYIVFSRSLDSRLTVSYFLYSFIFILFLYSIRSLNFFSNSKKCPYCFEDIKKNAMKCKHCFEPLNNSMLIWKFDDLKQK